MASISLGKSKHGCSQEHAASGPYTLSCGAVVEKAEAMIAQVAVVHIYIYELELQRSWASQQL